MYKIKILPRDTEIFAPEGANLLAVLREHRLSPDAPCGGQGTCGKCQVLIDGQSVKACAITVDSDISVTLTGENYIKILKNGEKPEFSPDSVLSAAFDIGTTSVVCNLVDEEGCVIISEAAANQQKSFGADVVTRIRAALSGHQEALTRDIRQCMTQLLEAACEKVSVSPGNIQRVAVVGNPAMQQLFLGISPRNLIEIPFSPVLTKAENGKCGNILPICADAELLTVPDISGYVGADTLGCILSSELYRREDMTLLVDIGTNGEMVLGNRHRMICCATAAGPALEGANIRFGMPACSGAIDHIWLENGQISCSTIGGEAPRGICGSGVIDAVEVFLELGRINNRGRIVPGTERDGEQVLFLTEDIFLTQEDIRQVQLAKGAIRAGIELMVREMGLSLDQVDQVLLAGAFGSFISPVNACKIGLLPPALLEKIRPVGNAAAQGANLIASHPRLLRMTELLAKRCEYLELSSQDGFPRAFAKAMLF